MTNEMRTLLEGLLQRDVDKRLGCLGRLFVLQLFFFAKDSTGFSFVSRAEEVKEHPYFKEIDWKQVYLLKLTPPLIPPRGEVNAADAFDIGNFDEDDTKGIKVRLSLVYFCSTLSSLALRSRSRTVQKLSDCHFGAMATGDHW